MRPPHSRQLECTIPILPVRDLRISLRFYVEQLGFHVDWGDDAGSAVCSVSRDGCPIMLKLDSLMGRPGWVWIGVESVDSFEEWKKQGARVLQEPRNFSWAYEMKFLDPDDNVLWVGTEPRPDLPFEDGV